MNAEAITHGRFAGQPLEAVPAHHQLWMLAMNASVSDKIAQLLERTDKIKRGSAIDRPTRFNAAGERHAKSVAARDAAVHCGHERTQPTPPIFTPSTESHS